jgi:hypothetical protein
MADEDSAAGLDNPFVTLLLARGCEERAAAEIVDIGAQDAG